MFLTTLEGCHLRYKVGYRLVTIVTLWINAQFSPFMFLLLFSKISRAVLTVFLSFNLVGSLAIWNHINCYACCFPFIFIFKQFCLWSFHSKKMWGLSTAHLIYQLYITYNRYSNICVVWHVPIWNLFLRLQCSAGSLCNLLLSS